MGLAGVIIVAGYHLSLNLGERSAASGVAALIVALSPAFTLAFAILLGLERFSLRVPLGLALAFAGVVVVVTWARATSSRSPASRAR